MVQKISPSSITSFFSGFALGFGLSLIVDAKPHWTIVLSVLIGLLVAIAGSLLQFVISQIIGFSVFTLGVSLYLGLSDTPISTGLIQVTLPVILTLSPIVFSRISSGKKSVFDSANRWLELVTSLSFLAIVLTLRSFMPPSPIYALNAIFPNEDNAGMVAVLSSALNLGVTNSSLGETSSLIYVLAAGAINSFGNESFTSLIAPFTHLSLTLGYLALVPITVYVAMALSGIKLKLIHSIFGWIGVTVISALLIWPFSSIGHTSALLSSQLALPLFTLLANQKFLRTQPITYSLVASSLAFLASNVWFPLLPLAFFGIGIVFFQLVLNREFLNKNSKILLSIILIASILVVFQKLFPYINPAPQADEDTASGVYRTIQVLTAAGGTRAATITTVLIWAFIVAAIAYIFRSTEDKVINDRNLGTVLFFTAAIFSAGAFYLLGMFTNGWNPGYGATKYLVLIIGVTLPAALILLQNQIRLGSASLVSLHGILIFTLVLSQGELALIAKSPLFTIGFDENTSYIYPDVRALATALESTPNQILCTDKSPDSQLAQVDPLRAYHCSRWGSSLVGADGKDALSWRFSHLDRAPKTELTRVATALKDENLAIIFFDHVPTKENSWWVKYSGKRWIFVESIWK